jgi:pimeloyl-ACP methyl ester carboxylesterase
MVMQAACDSSLLRVALYDPRARRTTVTRMNAYQLDRTASSRVLALRATRSRVLQSSRLLPRAEGREAMPELCVIVPGIGGSVLTKDGKTLWDVSNSAFFRALISRGQPFQELSLATAHADGDGVLADRLIHGAMVIPGFWNYGDYRPFTRRMAQLFGGAPNVVSFPYDWRRSNTNSAGRLKSFVDDLLSTRPVDTKVVLIGHSMGGLVARRYLATEAGYERCSMLVTLGTPFQGAAKALDAVARGIPKIPGKTGARLHSMLRSLPSVHELLPTYPCFVQENRRVTLADCLPEEVSSTGLFAAAAEFHRTTSEAVAALGSAMPPTLAVVGQQQPTLTLARLVNGTIEALPDESWATSYGSVRGAGDGTVPRISAQPPEWGQDTTRAHAVTGRHINLPSDIAMHKAVAAALEGRKYLGLGAVGGISVNISEVVTSGERVVVEVHHPDDRLELDVWATNLDGGATEHHSILPYLGDGRYERAIASLGPGTYEVRVEGLADGAPQVVSDLVTVLPVGIQ